MAHYVPLYLPNQPMLTNTYTALLTIHRMYYVIYPKDSLCESAEFVQAS